MSNRTNYLAYLASQGFTPNRAVCFEEGSGDFIEHYTGRKMGLDGTPTWSTVSGYTCGLADATGDRWYFLDAALTGGEASTVFLSTTAQTVMMVRACTDTTARVSSCFGTTSTTNTMCQAHIPYSDNTCYWDFGKNGSFLAPNRLTKTTFNKTTSIETLAFRAGAAGSSIWRNGSSVSSQATGISRSADAGAFYINRGSATTGDLQNVLFFALIPDEVSDAVLGTFIAANVLDAGFYSAGSLFRINSSPNGLGSGGKFFKDPLG